MYVYVCCRLEECVDRNSIAAVTQQLALQWLAIRLDFMGVYVYNSKDLYVPIGEF